MKMHPERGAILVHVALVLLSIIGFSAFTIDYGQFWVARRQAQNAADAGALAGAISRIYDDQSSPPSSTTSGVVFDNAVTAVALNRIWGVPSPSNAVTLSYDCPGGTSTNCVEVDVYRDGTNNSNPLSTFFLQMLGVNTHGVRAHAVAEIVGANATGCMRPWFLIDRYTEVNGVMGFQPGVDQYSAPGYRVPEDIGTQVQFHENTSPSGYGQVDVGSGTNAIRDAIRYCANGTYRIGQVVDTKPGGSNGQKHGTEDVLSWDPGATFNPTTGRVEGSCAATGTCGCGANCPYGGRISPRVMIVPVCSPAGNTPGTGSNASGTDLNDDCRLGGPNNGQIKITNFLSFFLDSYDDSAKIVYATLMGAGGEVDRGGDPAPLDATFLKTVVLIR